mmetsp:Transcript_61290/g.158494  ORF Transcript_61290/g.158494 Transcript_61290/m.158494 type:complete len:118 (+) Transcript_61290:165-518(+)
MSETLSPMARKSSGRLSTQSFNCIFVKPTVFLNRFFVKVPPARSSASINLFSIWLCLSKAAAGTADELGGNGALQGETVLGMDAPMCATDAEDKGIAEDAAPLGGIAGGAVCGSPTT